MSVTNPFLDHLIIEINERFGDAPVTVIKGFVIVPHIFLNQKDVDWKGKFSEFAEVYQHDLPGFSSLEPELLMWEV